MAAANLTCRRGAAHVRPEEEAQYVATDDELWMSMPGMTMSVDDLDSIEFASVPGNHSHPRYHYQDSQASQLGGIDISHD